MMMKPHDGLAEDVKLDWLFAGPFEDKSMHALRHWLIEQRFRDSTDREDMQQSTDYVVELSGPIRIASRVRRLSSTKRLRDLTLRYSRASGAKTEYAKFLVDPPDLYSYVWADEVTGEYVEHVILDARGFAASRLIRQIDNRVTGNRDGRTSFVSWAITELQEAGFLKFGIKYPEQPLRYHWTPSFGQDHPVVTGVASQCESCGSKSVRLAMIHEGKSVRADCAECGRFIEFVVWYQSELAVDVMRRAKRS